MTRFLNAAVMTAALTIVTLSAASALPPRGAVGSDPEAPDAWTVKLPALAACPGNDPVVAVRSSAKFYYNANQPAFSTYKAYACTSKATAKGMKWDANMTAAGSSDPNALPAVPAWTAQAPIKASVLLNGGLLLQDVVQSIVITQPGAPTDYKPQLQISVSPSNICTPVDGFVYFRYLPGTLNFEEADYDVKLLFPGFGQCTISMINQYRQTATLTIDVGFFFKKAQANPVQYQKRAPGPQ